MLATQRTLDGDPQCRQRLDHRRDVLRASLAADHERRWIWGSLEHDDRIANKRRNVIRGLGQYRCSQAVSNVVGSFGLDYPRHRSIRVLLEWRSLICEGNADLIPLPRCGIDEPRTVVSCAPPDDEVSPLICLDYISHGTHLPQPLMCSLRAGTGFQSVLGGSRSSLFDYREKAR